MDIPKVVKFFVVLYHFAQLKEGEDSSVQSHPRREDHADDEAVVVKAYGNLLARTLSCGKSRDVRADFKLL